MPEVLVFDDESFQCCLLKCNYTDTGHYFESSKKLHFIYEISLQSFLSTIESYLNETLSEIKEGWEEDDETYSVLPLIKHLGFPKFRELVEVAPCVASSYIRELYFNDVASRLMSFEGNERSDFLVYRLNDLVFFKNKVLVYGIANDFRT